MKSQHYPKKDPSFDKDVKPPVHLSHDVKQSSVSSGDLTSTKRVTRESAHDPSLPSALKARMDARTHTEVAKGRHAVGTTKAKRVWGEVAARGAIKEDGAGSTRADRTTRVKVGAWKAATMGKPAAKGENATMTELEEANRALGTVNKEELRPTARTNGHRKC